MFRLLRSTSVRLALGYALLFAASSLLLVGMLWWRTTGYLVRGSAAVIRADTRSVADDLRDQGLPGAIETIKERLHEADDGSAVYLLADGMLKPIAGNLAVWPPQIKPKAGWYEVPIERLGRVHLMQIEEAELAGGLHLLAGRDIEDREEIRGLIVDGLVWAAAGGFALAIIGGILVRQAVLRRVEAINHTAGAFVRGDLSRRLVAHGTADEFDQLAQTINAMLQQIETLFEGMRNTTNAVAHDLRTPLAELRAQLEDLIRDRPPRQAMLDGIHKAVADIDRLIGVFNALLRLVEIDSGVRRSGFRRVDLAEIATEVAELYGPLTEEKTAVFSIDAADGLAVSGDPHLLAQAVGNLVDNAVKFTPCGGTVCLRIARGNDGDIDIVVADNGPGIADADKPRVVERFYRCNANSATPGIGLGLSLVQAVARLHDGRLTLTDNHPGLTASLKLPAAYAPPPGHSALA